MQRTLFVINDGIYPKKVGGMEIFNYHLIKELSRTDPISYMANSRYEFDSAQYVKSSPMKPSKLFIPIGLFIYLLFKRRSVKNIVLSFSSAHWLLWKLLTFTVNFFRINTVVIIHHGKDIPCDHKAVYKSLFKSAGVVVAVSEDIKRNYDKAYDIECKVIYPLIPFHLSIQPQKYTRASLGIPSHAKVITMVGTIKRMKNPNLIMEAIKLFTPQELKQYNPIVVYAGSGPMLDELKSYVVENNLVDNVRFLNLVPNEFVSEVMALSDVYVISSDFEGTSVSLLEAMYNSKPIIASNVPGLKDMISSGKNGLLFDVTSPLDLKQSLLKYLSSPSYAECLGACARATYDQRYSYDDILSSYSNLLS